MVKMALYAVLFVALLSILAGVLGAALHYWPVTIIVVGAGIAGFIALNKRREKRNQV
jgi:hypothetical protein